MEQIIIFGAAFLGGFVNSLAGGGSFFTLPALIYAGLPPVVANATGTAALLPGYIASAWRYRKDIEFPKQISAKTTVLLSLIGGSLGAVLLMKTSNSVFLFIVPWLVLFATLMFWLGPKLLKQSPAGSINRVEAQDNITVGSTCSTDSTPKIRQRQGNQGIYATVMILIVSVYGGYFNGGFGIILLATLNLLGGTNLLAMNGAKNIMSAILTSIAVIVYLLGGSISFSYWFVLSIAAILGGYLGAALSYRISPKYLRYFIIFIGCALALVFFME